MQRVKHHGHSMHWFCANGSCQTRDKEYRRWKQVDTNSHKEKLRISKTSCILHSFLSTNDAPRNLSYVIPSTPAPSLWACSIHDDDNRSYSQLVPPFTCCVFHELSTPTVPVRFLVLCSTSSKRCSSHIVIYLVVGSTVWKKWSGASSTWVLKLLSQWVFSL